MDTSKLPALIQSRMYAGKRQIIGKIREKHVGKQAIKFKKLCAYDFLWNSGKRKHFNPSL